MPIKGTDEQDIITAIIVEPDKTFDELLEEGKSFKENDFETASKIEEIKDNANKKARLLFEEGR